MHSRPSQSPWPLHARSCVASSVTMRCEWDAVGAGPAAYLQWLGHTAATGAMRCVSTTITSSNGRASRCQGSPSSAPPSLLPPSLLPVPLAEPSARCCWPPDSPARPSHNKSPAMAKNAIRLRRQHGADALAAVLTWPSPRRLGIDSSGAASHRTASTRAGPPPPSQPET